MGLQAIALAAALLLPLVAPAGASAAPPVTLGQGPGGLLALDAAGGKATAVIGNANRARPFALLSSDARSGSSIATFGALEGRDPDVVSRPGGAEIGWGRIVNAGVEYSTASLSGRELGAPSVLAKGTGPPRLTVVGGRPVVARADALGNVTLGGAPLTTDGPMNRHLPLDIALADERTPIVLDLAQQRARTVVSVLGTGAPQAPVLFLDSREDIDGSLAVDDGTVYVGFMRDARAYLASAPLRADARWSVERLPGPGGGSGAPAVARAGGVTYVAYGQGSRRRDVYLARVASRTTVRHLTRHAYDDSRPLIAPAGDGDVFVGWTRERRGAETGIALLMKTG